MKLPTVVCVFICITVSVGAQQPCPAVSATGSYVFNNVAPDFCCYVAADANCKSDNDCTEGLALAGSSDTPFSFVCHSGTCIYVVDDMCSVQLSGGAPPCPYDTQVESYCMTDLTSLENAEANPGDTPSAPTPTSNTAACIVPGASSNYALSDVASGSCCYVIYSSCKSTIQECLNSGSVFTSDIKYDCDVSNGTCYYITNSACDPNNFDSCTYSSNLSDTCHELYTLEIAGPGVAPAPAPALAPAPTPTSTPTATPTPTPTPTPTLTSTPTFTPTPTSTPTATPTPTPTPTPASPAPSGGGGTSCIASNQTVTVRTSSVNNSYTTKVKNLKVGDEVLTNKGYRRYIGSIHAGKNDHTIVIHMDDGTSIELTRDHLIKTKKGFVHAKNIKVGDVLEVFANDVTGYKNVIETKSSTSHVVSPLTSSGTIVVNDVIVSCYAVVKYHQLANFVYIPVRLGIIESEYYTLKVTNAYNVLPMWFKLYSDIATLNFVYP